LDDDVDDDDDDVDVDYVGISRAWKSTGENVKALAIQNVGYYESKQHRPWHKKRGLNCSGCRIQAKRMEPVEFSGTKRGKT
jgi:hypothetical protein